jgi:Chaperone of endosialidase/Phage T7 tail fibre protein
VYRETPLAEPLVDFTDGATLVAADLDTNAKQSIYIQQELDDGLVDGLVNVIPNGDKGDIITSSNGQVWTIDTGAVTSAKILDGAVVDADINASAGIVDTKLAQITTANKVSGTAITTGNISTTGSITTTSTLSVQGLTFGRGGGANVNNTAAGANALASNSGGVDNTAMGNAALQSNVSGTGNTGIGFQSLYTNTTANFSTALGLGALYTNNAANNTAVGVGALKFNTSGANNTAIGAIALENNTTGSSNVGIGYSVAASSATVSNEVNISNGTVNARYQGAASAWTFVSDVRDKTDIENLTLGLDFIAALKPRKFKWNLRNTEVDRGKPSAGFIAQEVLETVEAFNAPYTNLVDANDPNQYTFAQANMIPILVKAIQELAAKVEALENSL